jgi:CBS domain-containing protein
VAMTVENVMTRNVASCSPNASLADAAGLMWEHDCGIIPVVDERRNVVGVVTDRDICMALAMNNHTASETPVSDVMSRQIFVCSPGSDVNEVLGIMKREQILRIPVVDNDSKLVGIVSLSDVVQRADDGRGIRKPDVSFEQVVETRKAITEHVPEARTTRSGKA